MENPIKKILIERDDMTPDEADNLIEEARNQLIEYIEGGELFLADDVCLDYFGLEPDYLEYLL